ncbi:hypothetical protein NM688_g3225 [Phlebia brevispora]|uniref:Uncharacterized protein n=1 Tax=Phlebia brevispora TaxID=194682 RepID=A0ACC1T6J2_9APHY|nr:hypothetical protein NM688_g3225 [Phlebia brevispora]
MERPASEFHTFTDYDDVPFRGLIVPQEVEAHPISGTPPQSRPPIRFFVHGVLGIRLVDAIVGKFDGLQGATSVVPLADVRRIPCRMNWPGYESWRHAIASGPEPYTLAKLAQAISRVVQRFFDDQMLVQSQEPRPDWYTTTVPFDKLYLIELRQITADSWQPVLSRVLV